MSAIRPESPADASAIREVNLRAFGRAEEADLVDALREAGRAEISLVATEGGRVVGHILFSPATVETAPEGLRALGLAPLAVLPKHQRKGTGSALAREGLAAARRAGWDAAVVLGHPAYYPRFGFVPAGRFGLRCAYDAPEEAFMAVELRPAALRGARGLVRYSPEFAGV